MRGSVYAGCRLALAFLGLGAAVLWPSSARGQASVLTWHNDNSRTGQNTSETILTKSNVNSSTFGKKCSYALDGMLYTQPLYVPNVSIGGGTHNVVYVATEHDSVYAFDADCNSGSAYWQVSFINPPAVTTMPCTNDNQPQCDVTILVPERGITATPAIDPAGGTIYVVAQTVENGIYTDKLHALDITTGAEKSGSPVVISATAPGHPATVYDATQTLVRSALLLLNGVVYFGVASNDSTNGWLLAYNAATLAPAGVFCTTPTGSLAGVWMSGAGVAADSAGNLYFSTGNGTFDANRGGANYGMTLLKVQPNGSTFTVVDYFTPFNEAPLSNRDLDLSSGGVLLLPDQAGSDPHEILSDFKRPSIFLVDRDNMGKFNSSGNRIVQTVTGAPQGYWSSPAYWNGRVYMAGVSDSLRLYTVSNGRLSSRSASHSSTTFGYPGSTVSISSNGTSNGIVWAIEDPTGNPSGGAPAVLHAYDATNVATELYNSNQAGTRDVPGPAVKFAVPTVVNGKVYVGTQTELNIYGLL
jgi:hypothetical protein